MKDLESLLESGETILWRGRPAPRAFTFRNWRRSLAVPVGFFVLLVAYRTVSLVAGTVRLSSPWLALLVAVGLWFGVGQLLWARLEWERVFYLLTDRRMVAVHGVLGRCRWTLPLVQLRKIESQPLGGALATLRLVAQGSTRTLYCLEHPEILIQLLQEQRAGAVGLSSCNPRLAKPV